MEIKKDIKVNEDTINNLAMRVIFYEKKNINNLKLNPKNRATDILGYIRNAIKNEVSQ